jgi:hypothetical protein
MVGFSWPLPLFCDKILTLNLGEQQMSTVVLTATHLVNLANFVVAECGADRKIECIKQFRHVTGLGLQDAVSIIELVITPPYGSDSAIVAAVREEVVRRRGEWNHNK